MNGIKAWAHVLENQLDENNPLARRAVTGILEAVEQQARIIEDMTRESSGVEDAASSPPGGR